MSTAQDGGTPKDSKGIDHKAFFDKYVEGKKGEKSRLEASINPKMSEAEKFAIEKQIFAIDKEMYQLETNPAPQISKVEEQIKSLKLDPAKEKYLLDAASKVESREDAQALVDFISDFSGATVDKTVEAADLTTP